MTHVLLPVTLLLRRAYAAELVWAALAGKAGGSGHRRIAERLSVPATTVRGWLRVFAGRLHAVWAWFIEVAVTAGVDLSVPEATGRWAGALVAVQIAAAAIRSRFGAVSVLGAVTPCRVAVACSGGRLLAPGWPPPPVGVRANTNRP